MKKGLVTIFTGLAILPGLAFSQTDISPTRADFAKKEKIYSPYVERTASNSDFAEGVYWGGSIRTCIPATRRTLG